MCIFEPKFTTMIEAIIFDMDGLLIDSEPFWRLAEIKVFKEYGITLTEKDCRKTTGMRVDEVVKHWAGVYPQSRLNVQVVVADILDSVARLITEKGAPLPGVMEAIDFCKEKDLKKAVASASNYALIYKVLDHLKIKNEFDVIQSAEHMDYGKPHPEVFIETAHKLNVNPENCLVFEDSVPGVIAAKAARMKVIAVPDHENFNKKGYCIANHKLESLKDFNAEIFNALID